MPRRDHYAIIGPRNLATIGFKSRLRSMKVSSRINGKFRFMAWISFRSANNSLQITLSYQSVQLELINRSRLELTHILPTRNCIKVSLNEEKLGLTEALAVQ